MPESLDQLRDVEEEALGNLLAWMLPGEDRDRMKVDIRAYREAVRAVARAEDAEKWQPSHTTQADAVTANAYTIADSFSAGRFPSPPAGTAS